MEVCKYTSMHKFSSNAVVYVTSFLIRRHQTLANINYTIDAIKQLV